MNVMNRLVVRVQARNKRLTERRSSAHPLRTKDLLALAGTSELESVDAVLVSIGSRYTKFYHEIGQ